MADDPRTRALRQQVNQLDSAILRTKQEVDLRRRSADLAVRRALERGNLDPWRDDLARVTSAKKRADEAMHSLSEIEPRIDELRARFKRSKEVDVGAKLHAELTAAGDAWRDVADGYRDYARFWEDVGPHPSQTVGAAKPPPDVSLQLYKPPRR